MPIEKHYVQKLFHQFCSVGDHVEFFSEVTSMLPHSVRKLKWSDLNEGNNTLLPAHFKLNIFSCFVVNELFPRGSGRYKWVIENTVVQSTDKKLRDILGNNAFRLQDLMNEMLSNEEDQRAIMMVTTDRPWHTIPESMSIHFVNRKHKDSFLLLYREYCSLLRTANKMYIMATEGKIAKLATNSDSYIFHSENEPFDLALKRQYFKSTGQGQETPEMANRIQRISRLSKKIKGETITYANNPMLDLLGIFL